MFLLGNETLLPVRLTAIFTLATLEELSHAELVQQDVFQVTERDLLSNVSLLSVAETGGAVIAAYLSEHPRHPVGLLIGWGGFVNRPRIVSDLLAVKSQARNLGLGGELKRLQAALALDRGFEEIVWTVDPLRAANAHLNFTKLGAISRQYEIDRYGSSFATGLYGGLPSDRLHVVWQITLRRSSLGCEAISQWRKAPMRGAPFNSLPEWRAGRF